MAEYTHPELRNLAAELSEEELGEIAERCLEDFRIDDESRSEWVKMRADWLKLYFQKDHPINPPWEGASTESLPLLAEACNQWHARAYPAMFPSTSVVRAIPVGKSDPDSRARAERVSTHMSWQLMVRNEHYKRDKDRLLQHLPLHGAYFTKTFYSPEKRHPVVQNVRAVDLVVPYGAGPRDIEELERKSHVMWMSVNKTRILAKNGYFIKEGEPFEMDEKSEVDEAHDDIQGLQESGYGDKTMCRIIEQHRLLDLDDDGIEEPYIVTLDKQSGQVLRIAIRYDTDELGNPVGGEWYDLKKPVEYFTHYPFLENPDGFYGLGYGHLIGQLNTAVNKLLRQSVDAGTLANIGNQSGFINELIDVKGGEIAMQLGKFGKIRSHADDINKGIFTFKFPGPNESLLRVMEMLMGRSDRLAMVTEALTGQTDKVMQPTAIMSLIEQGLQVFSSSFERVVSAQTSEFRKIYRLNRKFMDPKEYYNVLDMDGSYEESEVAREDYEADFQIMPTADPRQVTKQQKLAKAQAEYQTAMTNPLIMQSPVHIYNVSRRFFEAIDSENISEILPKPANNLPRMDDPAQENMGAFMDQPMIPMAFPNQDHKLHIEAHQQALSSRKLGDAGYYALSDHVQQHLRFMAYGSGRTGPQVMAQDAGNPMGGGAVEGALPGGNGLDMEGGGLMGEGESPEGPFGGAGILGEPVQ